MTSARCQCVEACGRHGHRRCLHREGEREWRGDGGPVDLKLVALPDGTCGFMCRSCRNAAKIEVLVVAAPRELKQAPAAPSVERLPYPGD